ncbi:hypothetical protein DI005_20645 [Prauserella sp. PE36]|nr:hypothetical protein DI005_20645 [Prauserella sp. PE36]
MIVPLTLTGDDTPEASTAAVESSRAEAPDVPEETRTPRPPDRDLAAVTAALRAIDPCQLIDPGLTKEADAGVVVPAGPHACTMVLKEDPRRHGEVIEARVGVVSTHAERFRAAPQTIAGAKAYQFQEVDEYASLCTVTIPVSHARAIEMIYEVPWHDTDTCSVATRFANAAVEKLRQPDSVAFTGQRPPFAGWDGCSLLARLLGDKAASQTLTPTGLYDPFAGCETPLEKNAEAAHVSLEMHYGTTDLILGDPRQVGDITLFVHDTANYCKVSWITPSGTGVEDFAHVIFEIQAKECDTATPLAQQAIGLIDAHPEGPATAPQRPLLYGPDERDTEAVGACVDLGVLGGLEDCEPYQEVTLPERPDEILAAARTSRHVQCGVFLDAVRAVLGDTFQPVTWGQHCFFVNPEHTLEVLVNVDPSNSPAPYGSNSSIHTDRHKIEIAGKAAITYWNHSRDSYDIYLSPHDDLGAAGNLHIGLRARHPRGVDNIDPPEVPAQAVDDATAIMTQVVQTFFR